MKEELIKLINEKSPGGLPLLLVIRGSHAYGTNVPTSDIDYAGVYIQSIENTLGNGYKDQINDGNNDIVIYEIKRFLELLSKNNPTIMELLNTPEDCILYKHPSFEVIIENRDKFITKDCSNSFGGYAVEQIKKARGLNKKQNWEGQRVVRKGPIDFCYIHVGDKSIPLTQYLSEEGLYQEYCGLSKIPHSRDLYALYYDWASDYIFSEKRSLLERKINKLFVSPKKFKGISFENSNEIRLTSIPKGSYFLGHITYNKDGYSQHCKDYKSYLVWQQERNESRWVDVKSHGQKIDGKNLMHCRRLLGMAREIALGEGIIVRRPDAEELLKIRKGAYDLEKIIIDSERDIKEIDELFKNSNLPNSVDQSLINDILISIRREIYKV